MKSVYLENCYRNSKPPGAMKLLYLILIMVISTGHTANASESSGQQISTSQICTPQNVELFSCELKSGKSTALCLNKANLSTHFIFIDPAKHRTVFQFKNITQIVGSSSAGGTTIIRGKNRKGKITLYLDKNTAENEGTSIIYNEYKTEHSEFCYTPSVRAPVTAWFGPKNDWMGGTNIFILISMRLAKPINLEEEDERNIWAAWPKEKK